MSELEQQESPRIDDRQDVVWAVPTAGALWTMRVLALGALGVALFLATLKMLWTIAGEARDVPFCSPVPWVDCLTVLTHPKWSHWFGVPVSLLAAGLYAVVVWSLFRLSRRRSLAQIRRIWAVLSFAAPAIFLAGVWFIYLQLTQVSDQSVICLWCMIDHALGMSLALLLMVFGVGLIRGWAMAAAVAAVALLIVGQWLYKPAYVVPIAGKVDVTGRYVEEGPASQSVPMILDSVVLSTAQHPVLGSPQARFVLVEVIDYTCPRCRRLASLLSEAMPLLGPDYAVMVITFPLDAACNPKMPETEPRHANACVYAKLAHAVSVLKPEAFAAFHHWLFANQQTLTPQAATEHAATLVDRGALTELLADPRLEARISRDLTIAEGLTVTTLPGLYLHNHMFPELPDEAAELAERIRATAQQYASEGGGPQPKAP